jgi:hypothetical protein
MPRRTGGADARFDQQLLIALLAERSVIARILAELGPSFRETRAALNELARIVGG